MTVKETIAPYIKQFNRSPIRIKIVASACLVWLAIPIDPFDLIFPWIAWQDDILIASYLLKLLHKYGSEPGDRYRGPKDLVQELRNRRKL